MNIWEVARDKYSSAQLWLKEDINNWSLGQVYMHVIHNIINYNFAQIKICISTNRNQSKKKTSDGENLFEQNLFPNARLKNPTFCFRSRSTGKSESCGMQGTT